MPKNVKKILNKKGYIYSDIISNWNYLVGSKISKVSYPKSFKPIGNNSPGILILRVQRGNEIDVEYSKSEIMNKINSHFGYKLIDEIKLQTFSPEGSVTKNKNTFKNFTKNFEEKINEIKNKNIRNSLSELLKIIKND